MKKKRKYNYKLKLLPIQIRFDALCKLQGCCHIAALRAPHGLHVLPSDAELLASLLRQPQDRRVRPGRARVHGVVARQQRQVSQAVAQVARQAAQLLLPRRQHEQDRHLRRAASRAHQQERTHARRPQRQDLRAAVGHSEQHQRSPPHNHQSSTSSKWCRERRHAQERRRQRAHGHLIALRQRVRSSHIEQISRIRDFLDLFFYVVLELFD